MGSFLKKLDYEKSIVGNMYSGMKKEVPSAVSRGLVRDFRVDEEYGMEHTFDPGLERRGNA